ncbi:hypothetical protein BBP40_004482 [Aspergillus hancockii]|nr:hypothetical protein BBP40_004482 [Aspergillus hancockii]
MKDEKSALEYYLFQLQKSKRHLNLKLTDAQSETEAYGGSVPPFIEATKYEFAD